MLERSSTFTRRREALSGIEAEAGQLEKRLLELTVVDQRLSRSQAQLPSVVEKVLVIAQAMPARHGDHDVEQRAAATGGFGSNWTQIAAA